MKRAIFFTIAWICTITSTAQECPRLTNPSDNSIEVPVNTTITWNAVDGVVGYLISLGTTPGGTEILNRRSAGLTTSFTPEVGLPDNTIIYVTIEMFLPGQQIILCPGESFRTIDVTQPPPCTRLTNPVANGTNVPVSSPLAWTYAPTATGYRINIGSSFGATDIVQNVDMGNVLNYKPSQEFELDQEIFVQIVPYNENGDALSCDSESFTTGIPVFDCEAVVDPANGTTYSLKPEIDFPKQIGFCANQDSKTIQSFDKARGFRWFRINSDGTEELVSNSNVVSLEKLGSYRYEAFNSIAFFGNTVECVASQLFEVVQSRPPEIEQVAINRETNGLNISVVPKGIGNYEYAIDDENGPFQDENTFNQIPNGQHTIFIRDKDGCGVASRVIEKQIVAEDFPQFFTPNGDGIHDLWQFKPPSDLQVKLQTIQIFDRYGNFLVQLDPKSNGWDGTFNGNELPASDYWFKAIAVNHQKIYGHFTLKR